MDIRHLIERSLDIRGGEYRKTGLMFAYIFLLILSYVIIKAVRDSLFLVKLGPEQLPYVYMLVAVIVGIVAWGHAKLSARVGLSVLLQGTLLLVVSNLLIFWWLFQSGWPWLFYVLYIWAGVIGLLTLSQYWLLANCVFNTREAKRLFGLVGAGAILGGLVGGVITAKVALWIGTESLLGIAAGGYLLCSGLAWIISRSTESVDGRSDSVTASDPAGAPVPSSVPILATIRSTPQLLMIAGLIGIAEIVVLLVDYQFKVIAKESFPSTDALTGFMGIFSALVSATSFISQVFFTGRILSTLGLGMALLCLPVGLLLGSLAIAVAPGLKSVVIAKLLEGTLRYSINKSGLELLYLPLPNAMKAATKPLIDPTAERVAGGVGGLLLLIATGTLSLSTAQISFLTIGLIGLWIPLAVASRTQYVRSLRHALEQRQLDLTSPIFNLSDPHTVTLLTQTLRDSKKDALILYILKFLEQANIRPYLQALKALLSHPSVTVRAAALHLLIDTNDRALVPVLNASMNDADMGIRADAMRFIRLHSKESDACLDEWMATDDPRISTVAMVAALNGSTSDLRAKGEQLFSVIVCDRGPHGRERRREAAKALRWIRPDAIRSEVVIPLIQDDDDEVANLAAKAAGLLQRRELVPLLASLLARRNTRGEAKSALLRYGDKILGNMADVLIDPQEPIAVRRRLPSIIAEIGGEVASLILLRNLHHEDRWLRYDVLRALNKIRWVNSDLTLDPTRIDTQLRTEIRHQYEVLLLLWHPWIDDVGQGAELFRRTLRERQEFHFEMVFRLLALRLPIRDVYDAYTGLIVDQPRLRALAVEFMDNLLPPDLKPYLIPVIDQWPSDQIVEVGRRLFALEWSSREDVLSWLIRRPDPWLKACALFSAGEWNCTALISDVQKATDDPDPLVRDAAVLALKRLGVEASPLVQQETDAHHN
ncbi:MAG TPA: Npt1/Npt2 family nucleotide transporter [Nitrospira sp.]|nr:Npt1/Npt2 family nucleotide transporter [Nitrospira sp.]